MSIFDAIFKIFKPIEDLAYKYYDNDYMMYAVIIGVIVFFIALGFTIFKFVISFFD